MDIYVIDRGHDGARVSKYGSSIDEMRKMPTLGEFLANIRNVHPGCIIGVDDNAETRKAMESSGVIAYSSASEAIRHYAESDRVSAFLIGRDGFGPFEIIERIVNAGITKGDMGVFRYF